LVRSPKYVKGILLSSWNLSSLRSLLIVVLYVHYSDLFSWSHNFFMIEVILSTPAALGYLRFRNNRNLFAFNRLLTWLLDIDLYSALPLKGRVPHMGGRKLRLLLCPLRGQGLLVPNPPLVLNTGTIVGWCLRFSLAPSIKC